MASKLAEPLRSKFKKNFEEGMKNYYDTEKAGINGFQKELARYLSSFTVGSFSTFRRLLRVLRSRDHLISTLNYDLLIEDAALQLGGFIYGVEKRKGCINVIKLHGSCNFLPQFDVPNIHLGGTHTAYVGPYKVVSPASARESLRRLGGISPGIAVYAKGKPFIVVDHELALLTQSWQRAVISAEFVFIIGVSVNPDDRHIWETLAKHGGQLYYFGLPYDRAPFLAWCENYGCNDAWFVDANFQSSVSMIRNILSGFSPFGEYRLSKSDGGVSANSGHTAIPATQHLIR